MAIFGGKKNSHEIDYDDEYEYSLSGDDDLSADSGPRIDYKDDYYGESDEYIGLAASDLDEGDSEDKKPPKKIPLWGIIVGGIALIVALLFVFSMFSGDEGGDGGEDVDSSVEGSGDGVVVEEQVGQAYVGSENGRTDTGTGAILAFDYQYYVNRDGDAARAHFNPDASYDAAFIQASIDQVPQGTSHELSITPTSIGQSYDVVLTLDIPNSEPYTYNQKFEVMEVDGEYFVRTFNSSTPN